MKLSKKKVKIHPCSIPERSRTLLQCPALSDSSSTKHIWRCRELYCQSPTWRETCLAKLVQLALSSTCKLWQFSYANIFGLENEPKLSPPFKSEDCEKWLTVIIIALKVMNDNKTWTRANPFPVPCNAKVILSGFVPKIKWGANSNVAKYIACPVVPVNLRKIS